MKLNRILTLLAALTLGLTIAVVPLQAEPADAACTVAACTGIPSGKQAVAVELMSRYSSGALTANGYPDLITNEIAPIAAGNVNAACDVDVRVLQVLLILSKHFSSVNVTDMNRACAGDPNFTCQGSTSTHCTPLPAAALDIDNLGGVPASVAMSQSMLGLVSTFVPAGTYAEINCESGSYPNITRFAVNNSCNHQHIDFRGTSAPLDIAPAVETIGQVYISGGSWVYGSTGKQVTGASHMSTAYMSGSWPATMVNANGTLRYIYGDSTGWHNVSTGLSIGVGTPIAAVNKGGTAPRVYANMGGNLMEISKGSTWVANDTGIDIGPGSPISAVDMGGSWGQIWANIGGTLHQIYANSTGWHLASSGKTLPPGASISAVRVNGSGQPQLFFNNGGYLHQMWAGSGWVVGNTGVQIGSAVPSAVYLSGTSARIYLSIGGQLHEVSVSGSSWLKQNSGLGVGNNPLNAVKVGSTLQIMTRF